MRVFLVRHAQTSWNVAGRMQGHTDIGLDSVGLAQADAAAAALLSHPILCGDAARLALTGVGGPDGAPEAPPLQLISSDLCRCVQTAEPIARAFGLPISTRMDLRERTFGQWEGLPGTEVTSRFLARSLADGTPMHETRAEGGESLRDVWDRILPLSREIEESFDDVIVVTHGGVGAALLARLIHGTLGTVRAFRLANGSITELERRPEGMFLILKYNDTSHLSAPEHVSATGPS